MKNKGINIKDKGQDKDSREPDSGNSACPEGFVTFFPDYFIHIKNLKKNPDDHHNDPHSHFLPEESENEDRNNIEHTPDGKNFSAHSSFPLLFFFNQFFEFFIIGTLGHVHLFFEIYLFIIMNVLFFKNLCSALSKETSLFSIEKQSAHSREIGNLKIKKDCDSFPFSRE